MRRWFLRRKLRKLSDWDLRAMAMDLGHEIRNVHCYFQDRQLEREIKRLEIIRIALNEELEARRQGLLQMW